ncbi:AMP-dependent synthetase/ligase [Faecalibacter macacae]|uniref:Long-chain fatty acid--CoA ligase n=1 Tax=Faecalibacter macacae TaxID=1859289 RepID=A0A3L9MCM1_9FLAO|nr:long-chain fatty acid--CoA ligase [Faecalibacter macacae]RLZ10748.1 long-chain fatty acid--CoA ligase [Faecalibacter macacae]
MNQPKRLFDLPYRQLELFPNLNMLNTKVDGQWKAISSSQFIDMVNEVSRGLIAVGVKPGEKVGLISENRLEWNVIDFAIQQVGGVVVAIYPNISDSDYEYIFKDANIKVCFVSNDNLYDRINTLKSQLPTLDKLFMINSSQGKTNWNELKKVGNAINQSEVEASKEAVKEDDLATLIYTSGTTGNPKGVMLSHKNILSNSMAADRPTPTKAYDKSLTFLPACHAYERMIQYLYMYKGMQVYFAESMDTIGENMKEVQPDMISAVPRLLEKVYEKIMAKGNELTGFKRKLFFWAVEVGEAYDPDPTKRDFFYDIKYAIAHKLVLSKWKEGLGGNLGAVCSGSAALNQRLMRLYFAAKVNVYEGYGLTEASPLISVNSYQDGVLIGTVGPAIPGVEFKLADDGEIMVKGPNVMLGYYNNPEATAEVLKEGWLYTGDIGEIIDNKFLKIVDRKKEMFKTSGGKYIVPTAIESKMVESDYIEQMMVIGENHKFPAALIVPSYQNLLDWAKTNAKDLITSTKEDFFKSEAVYNKVMQEVEKGNANLGNWEKIKKVAILSNEFTIDGGELTPTLKLKRKVIIEKYKKEIEEIYQ